MAAAMRFSATNGEDPFAKVSGLIKDMMRTARAHTCAADPTPSPCAGGALLGPMRFVRMLPSPSPFDCGVAHSGFEGSGERRELASRDVDPTIVRETIKGVTLPGGARHDHVMLSAPEMS